MKRIALSVLLAAAPAAAQQPPVGYIDVYGARTLTAEQVRAAAGIAVVD